MTTGLTPTGYLPTGSSGSGTGVGGGGIPSITGDWLGGIGTSSVGSNPISTPVIPYDYPTAAGDGEGSWILTGLLSDRATIAPVGIEQMVVTNLQQRDPTRKWRGTGRTESFLFTMPGPVACNAVAWVGHNHTPGGSMRVRGGDAVAGGVISSILCDTNFASTWPLGIKPQNPGWSKWISILRWDNDDAYPYWQLDVGDDGAGLVDLEAGRVMMGRAWQTEYAPDVGASFTVTNNDFRNRSPWNKIQTSRRLAGRTMTLPFFAADESEAVDNAMELQRTLGNALDLVVARDPTMTTRFHWNTLHGTLMSAASFEPLAVWSASGRQWKFELPVEEL